MEASLRNWHVNNFSRKKLSVTESVIQEGTVGYLNTRLTPFLTCQYYNYVWVVNTGKERNCLTRFDLKSELQDHPIPVIYNIQRKL